MFDGFQAVVSGWPRLHVREPWYGPDSDEEWGGATRARRLPSLGRVFEAMRLRLHTLREVHDAHGALVGRAADARRAVPGV